MFLAFSSDFRGGGSQKCPDFTDFRPTVTANGGAGCKKSGIMASMMPENFQDWQKKIKFRRRRRRNLEKFRFFSQKMAIFGKKWPKNAIKTQNIGYIEGAEIFFDPLISQKIFQILAMLPERKRVKATR